MALHFLSTLIRAWRALLSHSPSDLKCQDQNVRDLQILQHLSYLCGKGQKYFSMAVFLNSTMLSECEI